VLFDTYGCGPEHRKLLSGSIRSGKAPFREAQDKMWGSLNVPFEVGFELMRTGLRADPGLLQFYEFCNSNSIPFNVMSSGMEPILRRVLELYVGKEEVCQESKIRVLKSLTFSRKASRLQILANGLDVTSDGSQWKPVWRHDSHLGHDKAISILEYRTEMATQSSDGSVPLIIFLGDGVSDLAAAQQADVLFARRGLQLEQYCIDNRIPYVPFDTFFDIQREVTRILDSGCRSPGGRIYADQDDYLLSPPFSPQIMAAEPPVSENFEGGSEDGALRVQLKHLPSAPQNSLTRLGRGRVGLRRPSFVAAN
jgi:2-hydroxy-3-keto-5-methylthiopentenyl-1-phosphate phosphatase